MAPAAVLLSFESLLRWTGARFVHGKATAMEPEERRVRLEGGDAGLRSAGGGSWKRAGNVWRSGRTRARAGGAAGQEALRTRRHLTARLHDAAFWDGEERRAALRFVIVGGGLTGVELAGELADGLPAEARGLAIDPYEVEIVVMEAGRRLLPGLDERTTARPRPFWPASE